MEYESIYSMFMENKRYFITEYEKRTGINAYTTLRWKYSNTKSSSNSRVTVTVTVILTVTVTVMITALNHTVTAK